jgi:hypothetical protein
MQGPINIRAVKPDAYLIHCANTFSSAVNDNGGCQFKLPGNKDPPAAVEAMPGSAVPTSPWAGRVCSVDNGLDALFDWGCDDLANTGIRQ